MTIIVGAGATGLALAWLLQKEGHEVQLFEAGPRPGGNIRSEWHNGHLLEFGPNSLRMTDALHAFLTEAGMADLILPADAAAKKRYVLSSRLSRDQYRPLPSGLFSFLFGGFFPWPAKRRVIAERNLKSSGPPDETADAFIRRRFGPFVADELLTPFVSGIYAGDSRQLIAAKAFPFLVESEKTHGSVIRGMFKMPRSKHKGIFSFPGGLQSLTDRLAADLGHRLQLNTPLKALRQITGGWEVHVGRQQLIAKQVVLCIPAHQLAGLLETLDPGLSQQLGKLNYPPLALVHRTFRREDITHPLDGFGALHPPASDAFSLGTIFSSSVFPGRSPIGTVLLTTMVGGAVHPDRALLPQAELLSCVDEDHRRFLGITGKPLFEQVTLYPQAIPQYDKELIGLDEATARWAKQGLHMAGNWAKGVSVPDCIQNARRLCEQLRQPAE